MTKTTANKTSLVKIPDRLFFRIGEVAELAEVKPHVLRFWETEFKIIAPNKSANGQRVYSRSAVEKVLLIRHLLYSERYSIEGARKRIQALTRTGQLKPLMASFYISETSCAPPEGSATDIPNNQETPYQKAVSLARELQTLSRTPLKTVFKYG